MGTNSGGLASGFRLLVHLQGVLVADNRGHNRLPGLDAISALLDTSRVLWHRGHEESAFTRKALRGGVWPEERVPYKDHVIRQLCGPHGHKLSGVEVADTTTVLAEDTAASG